MPANMSEQQINSNPLTDLFDRGRHPFPADMEAMLWKLREVARHRLTELGDEPRLWAQGKCLAEGRLRLRRMLAAGREPVDGTNEGQ